MPTRRSFLASTSSMAAALALSPLVGGVGGARAESAAKNAMATRAIPSTGEQIPVVGMGTSGSFEVTPGTPEYEDLREVLKIFFEGGGKVIDTAPTYSNAEDVMGALLADAGLTPKAWLATKISGVTGRDQGLAQFNDTLKRLKTDKVELLQVHNLGDLETQLTLCRELKDQGKTRYVGVTHYLEQAQDRLADIVQAEKPDFLQINYSAVTRGAEKRVLPLAQDLGVAVMINRSFEDGKLFAKVADKELPPWAAEVGITSWAQAFLRFALSHPAVTVVIPATGKPHRQADNLKAGFGPALTEDQRNDLIAALA
ncbi:aldo/keto reductase [Hyphomicrobium nitrativorans NL23]|uniref:Aldo/keto reductase n=1 Tax=Hyphomicrobium nitrativorans NL23 TaxID=1029756 RepID=V5SAU0_9HYPH|nr:aldo/keto reductase [Hyphomicrobium nitrativorans]AHB47911.1 aldo/keto reductase [Hyphomicrobium nitrativorans NL23]